MSIFSDDDLDRLRSYYPEQPGKLGHRLTGHPLLTLESLVELGKRLPRSSVEYNAGDLPYGVDPDKVSHTGLSVEDTIRGIEECGSWMVLKNVDQDPAYKALLEEALAELAATVPELEGEPLVLQPFGNEPVVVSEAGEDLTVVQDTDEVIARAQEALGRAQADRADAAAITAALNQLRRAADFGHQQPA
jgi:hypothetical protein